MPPFAFHLLPGTPADWLAWAATGAPDVKLCDASLIAPAKALGCRVYYRPYLSGDDGDCSDGAAWAQQVIAAIRAAGGEWPDVLGYRNECNSSAAQRAQYDRYRAALHAAGFPGVVTFGSFSVGRPDWPDYANLAGAEAVELHEYHDLTVAGSAPWYSLRHVEAIRRGLLSPDMPLYLGEWGSDALGIEDAQKRRGWQDRGKLSAAQQVANLTAYLAGCAPSVRRVFVFADGPTPPAPAGWSDFATRGTPVEAAIRATWQQKGPTMLKFLDLSQVNNVTDWSALAANYDGVIVQTSYGGVSAEPRGAEYWAAAKAHGLLRMAYHYLYPRYNTPEQEAANFLRNVTIEPGDGWAVDVEEPCADPAAYSSAFMQTVQQATGAPRNWYSYPAYIAQYGITAARVGNPHLWLASYRGSEPAPPPGWASISIWQHTSNAVVPGVDGVVDEDLAYMTREQFAALCKPAPPSNGGTVDPLTQLALNRAKAANPAITPAPDSAIFKAYRDACRIWDANGRPDYIDPTPWLRNEAATATDAYVALDSGAILHARVVNGQWVVSLAEAKDRAAIFAAVGWGTP